MSKELSIVVPVLNEEESIPELLEWIFRVVDQHKLTTEVLLIDDGSADGSWEEITRWSAKDERVIGLKFNRNYGKSAALQTGFDHSSGAIVMTMDADLQDSPD